MIYQAQLTVCYFAAICAILPAWPRCDCVYLFYGVILLTETRLVWCLRHGLRQNSFINIISVYEWLLFSACKDWQNLHQLVECHAVEVTLRAVSGSLQWQPKLSTSLSADFPNRPNLAAMIRSTTSEVAYAVACVIGGSRILGSS